jgi:hypothetical protein
LLFHRLVDLGGSSAHGYGIRVLRWKSVDLSQGRQTFSQAFRVDTLLVHHAEQVTAGPWIALHRRRRWVERYVG